MAERNEWQRLRHWIGPFLLVIVVLAGGALLDAAANELREEWLVRAFLIIGVLAIVSYVMLVHLPQRRAAREFRALQDSYQE